MRQLAAAVLEVPLAAFSISVQICQPRSLLTQLTIPWNPSRSW